MRETSQRTSARRRRRRSTRRRDVGSLTTPHVSTALATPHACRGEHTRANATRVRDATTHEYCANVSVDRTVRTKRADEMHPRETATTSKTSPTRRLTDDQWDSNTPQRRENARHHAITLHENALSSHGACNKRARHPRHRDDSHDARWANADKTAARTGTSATRPRGMRSHAALCKT